MKLALCNMFDVTYLIISQKMSWTDKHAKGNDCKQPIETKYWKS